jgi:hypothetical protein
MRAFTDIMEKTVTDIRGHLQKCAEFKITYSKTDASIQNPKTWIAEEPYYKNYVRIDCPTVWMDVLLFPEGVKFHPTRLVTNPDIFYINDTSCQPKDILDSLKRQFYAFKIVSSIGLPTKSVFIVNLGIERKPLYCVIRGVFDATPDYVNLCTKSIKAAVSCDFQKMGLQ